MKIGKHPGEERRRLHHVVAGAPDNANGIVQHQQDGKGQEELERDVAAVDTAQEHAFDDHPQQRHHQRT